MHMHVLAGSRVGVRGAVRTHSRCRDGAPKGNQHGQEHEQPDAQKLHEERIADNETAIILMLATVGRSTVSAFRA